MPSLRTINDDFCSIVSISEMLRHRHLETHLHCERVVQLAELFGDRYGLDASDRHKLLYSAMFHDIGKIGIPDAILMHECELDRPQREVMELHSTIGETIVKMMRLEHSDDIAAHIRHHHENYDGSGYPDGLKGNTIPLLSRMLTILDNYDALRENRAYRPSFSHAAAVALMRSESGTKHDPELLELFLTTEGITAVCDPT